MRETSAFFCLGVVVLMLFPFVCFVVDVVCVVRSVLIVWLCMRVDEAAKLYQHIRCVSLSLLFVRVLLFVCCLLLIFAMFIGLVLILIVCSGQFPNAQVFASSFDLFLLEVRLQHLSQHINTRLAFCIRLIVSFLVFSCVFVCISLCVYLPMSVCVCV